jgi:uncharacterized membrane protein (DUF4010 family)
VAIATTVLNSNLARRRRSVIRHSVRVGAVLTAVSVWSNSKSKAPDVPDDHNPLQFLDFTENEPLCSGSVLPGSRFEYSLGRSRLLVSGAIVGFTDVDALVLSMARGAHGAEMNAAALALAIGILSNTVLKLGVVLTLGRGRFRCLPPAAWC